MKILERVHRCRYCKREITCSALSYAENPFCSECHDERVRAAQPATPVEWIVEGNYLIRADAGTLASGDRGPQRH